MTTNLNEWERRFDAFYLENASLTEPGQELLAYERMRFFVSNLLQEAEKRGAERMANNLQGHEWEEARNMWYERGREEGQKEVMKLANHLTENPDRAVRYVPLDKLFDAFIALTPSTEEGKNETV